MGIYTRIQTIATAARTSVVRLGERALYAALKTYYAVLELRDRANMASAEPTSKPLRNPVNRLVEFYVTHVWGGDLDEALQIQFEDGNAKAEAVESRITQIWAWSQWASKKQFAVREFTLTGDLVLKVVGVPQPEADRRVYLQIIPSDAVTHLEIDERGVVTYIKIDVPKLRRNERGEYESYTHTEEWGLDIGGRIWEHDKGSDAQIQSLGTPKEIFSLAIEEGGTGTPGFLPFVHAKFRDVGETRGMNPFFATIPKIDEADAVASKLHRMVFRFKSVLWALEQNALDSSGRPIPAAKLTEDGTTTSTQLTLGQERFVSVNGTMKCLVPPIDLNDANAILRDQVEEISKDLPELLYYEAMNKTTQLATATLRIMLAPAIARVLEVRGNAETALARANMIALTMAQNMGIDGFSPEQIGTYESGEFRHTFKPREVMDLSRLEKAEAETAELEADKLKIEVGLPLEFVLRERGYTADEIAEIKRMRDKDKLDNANLSQVLLDRAMQRFNAGTEAGAAQQ